jgi:transcriptional regulator with XRE-family HTH domain
LKSIGDRVKYLRKKELGINQESFGKQINVSGELVSNLERGERQLTDRTIADICREFNINEEWLRNGKGDIFKIDETNLDFLVARYGSNLTKTQKLIIAAVLKMTDKEREVFNKFLDELIAARK